MDGDRDLPELEIELLPAVCATGAGSREPGRPLPSRSDRRPTVIALVVALALVLVAFAFLDDDDARPEAATPTTVPPVPTRPASVPSPSSMTTTPTTTIVWTPAPALLGATGTNLLLWSFDGDSRLQWVDLDTAEVRHLSPKGGGSVALFDRGLVVIYQGLIQSFGNDGTAVINAKGDVVRRLGGLIPPVPVLGTAQVWVQTTDSPRHWQLQRPDTGIVVELPADAASTVVHYSSRVSLLVTRAGTSSFDIVTREIQPLTKTQVIAAGGGAMIGRKCADDVCTLAVIDFESKNERVLRSDIDVAHASLSPDGRYLAIARKSDGQGRFVEMIDVATSMAVWHSADGVSFTGVGPAWSWSPNSDYFFVTMSASQVIAVDVRPRPFRQTVIGLPHTPYHGIAVTLR